jgi:hypothetical protein
MGLHGLLQGYLYLMFTIATLHTFLMNGRKLKMAACTIGKMVMNQYGSKWAPFTALQISRHYLSTVHILVTV